MPTRLYEDLATWWHLLSPAEEYAEEAAFYARTFRETSRERLSTLLELGSGGGNNASHLKKHFDVTLVDISAPMVAESRRLNPELEHHVGDMRSVRLGRSFDAVFVHDALAFMATREDLRRAMETAYTHCRPGGVALFAPDHVTENFAEATDCGGSSDGTRGIRYLEWTSDPDPDDEQITVDYAYVIKDGSGSVELIHDRHIEGLFSRDTWLGLLTDVGFYPNVVPFRHTEYAGDLEVFACVRT